MASLTNNLFITLYSLLHNFIGCVDRNWVVVCTSGVTCGGKSTITKSLQQRFNGSILIKQDDYYLDDDDPMHVQLPALQWRNRELMTSLNMVQMRKDIENVICRIGVSMPVLILDGFMLYYDKYITSLCDLKFFFLLGKDVCKVRRKRRNKRIQDIDSYFEQYVWPAYLRYRDIAFNENPDAILIDGGGNNKSIIEGMTSKIIKLVNYKE